MLVILSKCVVKCLSIRTLVLKYLSHCGHFIASEVLWAALICSFGLSRLHTVPVGDAVKRSKYSNSKYIDKVVSRNISQVYTKIQIQTKINTFLIFLFHLFLFHFFLFHLFLFLFHFFLFLCHSLCFHLDQDGLY